MAILAVKALDWCVKNWRAVLLAALVAGILGWWWHHKAADNRMELRAIHAEADLAALQAQLAAADHAAKVAIAAKVEAENAAAAHLKAREKFWRDRYAHDPQARAWGAERVPDGVLSGLRP